MKRRSPWTPADLAALESMAEAGMSAADIATVTGRTATAVYVRMCRSRLGLRSGPSRDIIDRISDLIEKGYSYPRVGQAVGMTGDGVHNVCRTHGLVGPRSYILGSTKPHDADIIELRNEGLKTSEIGRRLGLPEWTVRSRLKTLARRDAVRDMQVPA